MRRRSAHRGLEKAGRKFSLSVRRSCRGNYFTGRRPAAQRFRRLRNLKKSRPVAAPNGESPTDILHLRGGTFSVCGLDLPRSDLRRRIFPRASVIFLPVPPGPSDETLARCARSSGLHRDRSRTSIRTFEGRYVTRVNNQELGDSLSGYGELDRLGKRCHALPTEAKFLVRSIGHFNRLVDC